MVLLVEHTNGYGSGGSVLAPILKGVRGFTMVASGSIIDHLKANPRLTHDVVASRGHRTVEKHLLNISKDGLRW